MEFHEFVEKLRKLNQDIHQKSIIILANDLDLEEYEEITKEDIEFLFESLKDNYKLILSTDLKGVMIPGNLHICWHYIVKDTKLTGGEFNFRGTQSLFVNRGNTSFKDKLTSYSKELYNQGYRFFDSHPQAGDSEVFALLLDGDKITSNVWHIDLTTEDKWPLEIDYFQYIDHTLALKGLYSWQYLFEEIDLKAMDVDMSGLGRRLEDYPRLFPGANVKEYIKRYKDRGGE